MSAVGKQAAPKAKAPAKAIRAEQKVAAATVDHTKAKAGWGIVKEVPSGDSLVLAGNPVDGGEIAPEKHITLSGITAPKIGRKTGPEEEPYAWESREFLRRMVIGQKVQFIVNYAPENARREYATVLFNGENLAHLIVRNGWATVNEIKNKEVGRIYPEREQLLALQDEAKREGRGKWRKGDRAEAHIRDINWSPDSRKLFSQYKGIPLRGIVDHVRDGSTLRIELLADSGVLAPNMITLYLAGVQAPHIPLPEEVQVRQHKRKTDGAEPSEPLVIESPEPWALEAQHYVAMRLLHRDVQVILQGVDAFGNLFGTVLFYKSGIPHNITHKLLELGYGKLVQWSANITGEAERLAQLEAAAKRSRLRIWADWTPDKDVKETGIESYARVVQVVSGDTIVVADDDGRESRFALASIRAPRMGTRTRQPEVLALEAREFLRKRIIGKKVRLVYEYQREVKPQDDSAPATLQTFVSVYFNKQNMAQALVARGLATVVRNRVHEPRASCYDALIEAQTQAEQQRLGLHDPKLKPAEDGKEPKKARIVDLTVRGGRKGLVKSFFETFQHERQMEAVVEHVFTGSRFKLYSPKHNVFFSFALAGIRAPTPSSVLKRRREDAKAEAAEEAEEQQPEEEEQVEEKQEQDEDESKAAFGDAALAFVRNLILQHDVRIDVEALDKGENFLGALYVNGDNLAVMLLREGLAEVFRFSADRSPHRDALLGAEDEAKRHRKNLWANYVEPEESEQVPTAEDAEAEAAAAAEEYLNVNVTEIISGAEFYVHIIGDPAVELVESKMRAFTEAPPDLDPEWVPTPKTVCAGFFGEDGYCRVRVEGGSKEEGFSVFFMDYGNHDVLPHDMLRPLPEDLSEIPPIARHCLLAGLKAPGVSSEYCEDAMNFFNELAFDRELLAKVELKDALGRLHVTLLDRTSPVSINRQILQAGWARLLQRPERRLRGYVQALKPDEELAKKEHRGIWEYGDVSDDEEEERPVGAFRSRLEERRGRASGGGRRPPKAKAQPKAQPKAKGKARS